MLHPEQLKPLNEHTVRHLYGEIVKATIWYGNPYMVWHDPAVPAGKWGQEMIINADGQCTVNNQVFNHETRKNINGQPAEHLQMPADTAVELLQEMLKTINYCGRLAKDDETHPTKSVTFENTEGQQYVFVDYSDTDPLAIGRLSMKIRDILNRADLWLLDGRSRDDFIEKLIVKFTDGDYSEQLVMSRQDENIVYRRSAGDGSDITTTYHWPQNVSAILDNLSQAEFTETIPGIPDNAVDPHGQFGHFSCQLIQRHLQPITFSGDYEKYCLPANWQGLMEVIYNHLNIPAIGVIMDEDFYNRRRRLDTDVIYLTVNFADNDRDYNYLTDDDSIEPGDEIIVPVGPTDEQQVVEVVAKHYYQPDEVPFPLDRIKKVIGKADADDWDDKGGLNFPAAGDDDVPADPDADE